MRSLLLAVLTWVAAGCSRPAECDLEPPTHPPAATPKRTHIGGTNPGLLGFADYHAHLFSNEAFGGGLFHGDALGPVDEALGDCGHTCRSGLRRQIVESRYGPHGPDGYPEFESWPTAESQLHQQAHVSQLYRAYTYGLRLVVVSIVNSEVLCRFVEKKRHRAVCHDMYAASAQLAQVRRLAHQEKTWLGVATSAKQAMELVADNKLAVVIELELDTLFGCSSEKECTKDYVVKRLNAWHRAGVRQVSPIHLADNAFGGNALYSEIFAANNRVLRGDYHDVEVCDVPWQLRGKDGLRGEDGEKIAGTINLLSLFKMGRTYSPKRRHIPKTKLGHCNERGLSDLGKFLVREMLDRGMLIALDHMSAKSADQTLELAEARRKPVILSHAWYRETKLDRETQERLCAPYDELRTEMHQPDSVVERIKDLEGAIAVLTNAGYTMPQGTVANDCQTSSKSFAQAYLHATKVFGPGVALGTDVNGLAGQPGPRFGPHACDNRGEPETTQHRLDYSTATVDGRPLTQAVLGDRTFDFNTDGLAHYGLVPDLIADLDAIGVPQSAIDGLYGSARAYIEAWKKAGP